MSFSTVDLIVLGVVLLFGLIGLFRGLIKSIFSLARGFVSLIVAYFFVSPVRNLLIGTSIGTKINTSLLEWVTSKSAELASITNPTSEQLDQISETLKLPKFLCQLLLNAFEDKLVDVSLGQAIADTLTYYALTIIAFIGLIVVFYIVIFFVSKLLNSLFESKALKPINRILGFAFGALMGVVIVSLVFLIGSIIPGVNDFLTTQIEPDVASFGIARFVYNHNIINWALENLISADKIFA